MSNGSSIVNIRPISATGIDAIAIIPAIISIESPPPRSYFSVILYVIGYHISRKLSSIVHVNREGCAR